jgi:hypothetical protein
VSDRTESLAERLLEIGDYERAYCWEMHAAPDVRLYDHHPDASCCEHASAYWATGAAAAELRRLEAETRRLREGIVREGVDLATVHHPLVVQPGKDPVGCEVCYPEDGSWPCTSSLIADALRALLDDPSTEEAPSE